MAKEINSEIYEELAQMNLRYQESMYGILGVVMSAKAAM